MEKHYISNEEFNAVREFLKSIGKYYKVTKQIVYEEYDKAMIELSNIKIKNLHERNKEDVKRETKRAHKAYSELTQKMNEYSNILCNYGSVENAIKYLEYIVPSKYAFEYSRRGFF